MKKECGKVSYKGVVDASLRADLHEAVVSESQSGRFWGNGSVCEERSVISI